MLGMRLAVSSMNSGNRLLFKAARVHTVEGLGEPWKKRLTELVDSPFG
jgi:hypothetical protein